MTLAPRPCECFTPPKDGLYPAYCAKCHFSRLAHEKWADWDKAAKGTTE